MTETRRAALFRGVECLKPIQGGGRDASILLQWATNLSAVHLSAYDDDLLTDEEQARYSDALKRRLAREPVSHIIGGREFWGRWFQVTPAVLDPRPETEIMVAAALEKPFATVLDLGTGSGCLLGTMLSERQNAKGVGVDASVAALKVAGKNLANLGVADRATLQVGDWLQGVTGAFDLIVCNPPYIAASEMAGLTAELSYEPQMALTPGGDGLAPYRAIAPLLRGVMAPTGRAMFEIGPTQANDVAAIFAAAGWGAPEVRKDFDGRDRCLIFSPSAANVR